MRATCAPAVDTAGRIHTIRRMSIPGESSLVSAAAAAVAARADVPRRFILPDCGESVR